MPPPRPAPTGRAGTRRSPGGTPVPPPSPAGPPPRSARFCPRQLAPREFGYPIHAVSVFPPLSPGAGNRSPTTSGSRSYTGCPSDLSRTPPAPPRLFPARPYWPSPFPRRPAPPTSKYQTAFPAASARPCSSSRNLPVDQTNPATDDPAPSLPRHYSGLTTTTSRSASARRIGTQRLAASCRLSALPLATRPQDLAALP